MPNESIVFDPLIEDRQLDKQAQKVDDRLEQSGQITPELGEVQGDLGLDGVGGMGGGGMGGMDGLPSAGGAGAGASLASRIPKPISGVTAGAALPAALVGGVGIGLLGAMQNASARLQTSTQLLGQAWNNVFRPLGDSLDQLFIRDLVTDLVGETQAFEETLRSGDWMGAFDQLGTDLGTAIPENIGTAISSQIRSSLGGTDGANILATSIEEAFAGFNVKTVMERGPIGFVQEVTGAMIDGFDGAVDASDFEWPDLPEWPGWPDIKGTWPEWPDIDTKWPGWPDIGVQWPGWPDIGVQWPGWPSIKTDWPGWPDLGTPSWPSSSAILNQFPSISVGSLRDAILGQDGGNNGGNDSNGDGSGGFDPLDPGTWSNPLDGFQRGGVINRPTPVMAGESGSEVITPIAELRRMMENVAQQASGGNGGGQAQQVDTSQMEQKLDQLNRNVSRLAQAMSNQTIEVNDETLGRLAADARMQEVTDTDPLVR